MAHSDSDATHERLAKLRPHMQGGTRFYNLDVPDEAQEITTGEPRPVSLSGLPVGSRSRNSPRP